MSDSRVRSLIVGFGLVTVTAVTTYVLSNEPANAAQVSSQSAQLIAGPCWHVGLSDWQCPDSMMIASRPDYVTSVSMTVETRDGKRASVRLPAGVDAIFLTREATEKFLLSYYWSTNKEKAQAVERKLTALRDAQR
jgi:hypothetical protein